MYWSNACHIHDRRVVKKVSFKVHQTRRRRQQISCSLKRHGKHRLEDDTKLRDRVCRYCIDVPRSRTFVWKTFLQVGVSVSVTGPLILFGCVAPASADPLPRNPVDNSSLTTYVPARTLSVVFRDENEVAQLLTKNLTKRHWHNSKVMPNSKAVREFLDRRMYELQTNLAKNTISKLSPYVQMCLLLVLLGGVVYKQTSNKSWSDAMKVSFFLLNNCPGSDCTDEDNIASAIVANSLYVLGLLTFAIFLGIVSEGVLNGVEDIRTSNSKVHEIGHTTILNWNSDSMVPLFERIATEHQKTRGSKQQRLGRESQLSVVVMAEKTREEMEEAISNYTDLEGFDKARVRIVTRTGSPYDLKDLNRVSIAQSDRIIILHPDDVPMKQAILQKAATLVGIYQNRSKDSFACSNAKVVMQMKEFNDTESIEIASKSHLSKTRPLKSFSRLWSVHALNHILAQGLFEPILVPCYQLLNSYIEGMPSIKSQTIPEMFVDCTFDKMADDLLHYGSVIGYIRKGEKVLNPDCSNIMLKGDKILLFSENHVSKDWKPTTSQPSDFPETLGISLDKRVAHFECKNIDIGQSKDNKPKKVLCVGWDEKVDNVLLKEVLTSAPSGSEITLLVEKSIPDLKILEDIGKQNNVSVKCFQDSICSKSLLRAGIRKVDVVLLLPSRVSIKSPDKLVEEENSVKGVESNKFMDTQTISFFLLLEKVLCGRRMPHVVGQAIHKDMAEMIEEVYHTSLFLLPEVESTIMVKAVNDPDACSTLCDILDPVFSNELDVRDISGYLIPDGSMSWKALVRKVREKNVTVIGYYDASQAKGYFNLKPTDIVPCKESDMLICIGNFR